MIKIKAGVDIKGIKPETVLGLHIVDSVFEDNGVYETVVTSVKDGTHKPGSLHYEGLAVDLRSKHIPSKENKLIILEKMKQALGQQWDVLLESAGKVNEHFHLEYDPD